MTTVTHLDMKTIGFCNRGARAFAERHGLDWADFMKNGIDAEVLLAIDDEMARQAVRAAILREMKGETK